MCGEGGVGGAAAQVSRSPRASSLALPRRGHSLLEYPNPCWDTGPQEIKLLASGQVDLLVTTPSSASEPWAPGDDEHHEGIFTHLGSSSCWR